MKSRALVPGNAGHHAVQFYSDDEPLCLSVADFLADGIAAQQPVIVIATPDHRKRIINALLNRRFRVDGLLGTGSVTLLDAEATLKLFMVNGSPSASKFRHAIGDVFDRVAGKRSETPVRAYGEMVDVLWRQGRCAAAIELEVLWNNLAKTYAFSLLCGYVTAKLHEHGGRESICALHTQVHA